MGKIDNLLVYHWQAWKGFLISHLVADYCVLEANYNDDIDQFEKYLTPNIKAVLFQINLTKSALFPEKRRQLIQFMEDRNILVFNTEIDNISKHNLHLLLHKSGLRSAKACESGSGDQLLFIKSNLNWGGEVEKRLPCELKKIFTDEKSSNEQKSPITSWNSYFIKRRTEIPLELWKNKSVVIEQFIENIENSFYRIYGFGDAIIIVKAHSNSLIKKIDHHPY